MSDTPMLDLLALIQRDPEWAMQEIAALRAERDALREQLRLANIDQFNAEAENAVLNAVIDAERRKG